MGKLVLCFIVTTASSWVPSHSLCRKEVAWHVKAFPLEGKVPQTRRMRCSSCNITLRIRSMSLAVKILIHRLRIPLADSLDGGELFDACLLDRTKAA